MPKNRCCRFFIDGGVRKTIRDIHAKKILKTAAAVVPSMGQSGNLYMVYQITHAQNQSKTSFPCPWISVLGPWM
jgi:hypothetical protein